jgi:hypothetical protein
MLPVWMEHGSLCDIDRYIAEQIELDGIQIASTHWMPHRMYVELKIGK